MGRTRNHQVRQETLRRDGMCVRCSTKEGLNAHHLVALTDGGLDCSSNAVALCGQCHMEWHHFYEGNVEWERFLEAPPLSFLLTVLTMPEAENLRLGELSPLVDMWRFQKLGFEWMPKYGTLIGKPRA